MDKKNLELLSPAKDLECGIAAINCGADAVYIGAPKFGARAAAGNSIEDIQKLVEYAHKFWAKVYVTINTIIYDEEIEEVRRLINKLYEIKVDAVIFQDMALLEMNIPPIQLIASTQTHNYELERIKLLDGLGIKRIILARELSLNQIKEIRANTKAELEFFVHGALCVCLSGQCYLSAAMFGRSANRGECAQPCRLKYSLVDNNGKVIVKDRHLLSLRDLNLSAYLNDLIEAGITCFKIEGRLKDVEYVKNITAYYRKKLYSIIENNSSLKKSSSGHSIIPFEPDPDRTFNRGYTAYFINGKDGNLGSIDTPKSIGKYIGKVCDVGKNNFTVDTKETIVNGDGLCFFDERNELTGMNVSRVENNSVFSKDLSGIKIGTKIYRNYDHTFVNELKKECSRKIIVEITIEEMPGGLKINAKDEDGVSVSYEADITKVPAQNVFQTVSLFKKQFMKSGSTIFEISSVQISSASVYFLPVKIINGLRRKILELLENERIKNHKIVKRDFHPFAFDNHKNKLNYKFNVANNFSKQFYKKHGAVEIEDGFELRQDHSGKTLMTCKYCILDELGMCLKSTKETFEGPLYLVFNNKKYKLLFNCTECKTEIVLS